MSHSLKSSIWTFFKKGDGIDSNKAICCLCPETDKSKKIIRGKTLRDFSTSPLWRHLEIKHKDKYMELKKGESKKRKLDEVNLGEVASCSTSPAVPILSHQSQTIDTLGLKQLTLAETLQRNIKWNSSDPKAMAVSKLICEIIALDCQPYAVVNRAGFRRLFSVLVPKYEMPNERTFSRELIPKLYEDIEIKLRQELKEALYISFTTDIWTCSLNNEAFISLSAHYICPKTFVQKLFTLAVTHFPNAHTAVNIADMVNGTINKWNINNSQLHVIMRDNAANIALGTEMTDLHGLGCFIHTLQLCINDAIFTQSSISTIINSCRKIVGHFNMSHSGTMQLKKIQENLKLPIHKLKQDVATRWNSTFEMLERIYEQRSALTTYALEHDIPQLPAYQWALVENIIRLLMPFNTITKEASNDGETISYVITAVKTLLKYLSKKQKDVGVQMIKEQLKCSVERRFLRDKKIDQNKFYVIANILDPRYKLAFIGPNDRDISKKWIINEMVDLHCINTDESSNNENLSTTDNLTVDERNTNTLESHDLAGEIHDSLRECYEEFDDDKDVENETYNVDEVQELEDRPHSQSPGKHLIRNKCKLELDMYLSLPRLPKSMKPLEWWAQNSTQFPHLTPVVLKYLSSPPSSVYSERIFSAAGRIYADNRANLKPQNAEKLLFLMKNLVYFNFGYGDK